MLRAIHLSLLLLCGFALSAQTLPSARRVYFIGNRCLVTDSLGQTSADFAASEVSVNFYPTLPKPSIRLRTPDESGYLLPTQFLKADGTVYGSTVLTALSAWNYAVASATGGIIGGGGGSSTVLANNLTTNDASQALAAPQGAILKGLIDNAQATASAAQPKITGKSLSTNDYTTAEQTKVANLSGTNTGDETTAGIRSKLGITTLSGVNTGDQVVNNTLTGTDATQALSAPQGKLLNDTKAPLASPALTGTPTAPTAVSTNNSTQIATTSFVRTLVGGFMRDSLSLYADSAQFQYNPTRGLQIKPGVLSGGSSVWSTSGTTAYYSTGPVGVGTATPNKLFHVAGAAQFDAIYLTGANSSETDARTIRSLNGVGTQINGGYTFNSNPEMSTQGNANVSIAGNWFWKIGGKAWFFNTNGYLSINNDTTTPTAYFDVNNAAGYDGLRLRNTYTPTSTSDANGQVGSMAWDASYFYIKTAAGWKRTALTTF